MIWLRLLPAGKDFVTACLILTQTESRSQSCPDLPLMLVLLNRCAFECRLAGEDPVINWGRSCSDRNENVKISQYQSHSQAFLVKSVTALNTLPSPLACCRILCYTTPNN